LRRCLNSGCLGDSCWCAAAGLEISDLTLLETLACAWEAIFELGLREAVVKTIAGGLRIGGEGSWTWRLSALNQSKGKRDERKQSDPAPSLRLGAGPGLPGRAHECRRA
jgi:hypothetical protein